VKNILLTGATGYIGKRLLPLLVSKGYNVTCLVRDKNRFSPPPSITRFVQVVEGDLLNPESLSAFPADIDGAYYLVHSMSASTGYADMEKESAINFRDAMNARSVKHIIYLGGIVNEEKLSDHLASRLAVENELSKGKYHFTALRAGIIIGSGSASYEIIRDLVEKLPVMVAPRWLNTRCQPIAVSDVLKFLSLTMFKEETFNQNFDIGGPEILTYREMLLGYAGVRRVKRYIYTVPLMTPRLSSYWLYFITSTSYKLAISLVDSMKVEVVCRDNSLAGILNLSTIGYAESVKMTLTDIEDNHVVSSWTDAMISSNPGFRISDFINVPVNGCFTDKRSFKITNREEAINRLWAIGGETGWYYATFLWRIRGFMDKLSGGVGLRRGRTDRYNIGAGDTLDFWRVIYADRTEGRLLLYAEMKLPGEGWLEFRIDNSTLFQTATFRPKGLAGRLYWFSVYPFHGLIFGGMIKKIARGF
jgi:uncharacterized protein YbjT (DUF2867 family)